MDLDLWRAQDFSNLNRDDLEAKVTKWNQTLGRLAKAANLTDQALSVAQVGRPIGPLREYPLASCVRLVRHENIQRRAATSSSRAAGRASDWSVTRIYPRFLRLIGPSREYTLASCVCWSITRIYGGVLQQARHVPQVGRPIGPSREYTLTSCV
eukprot:1143889-Pyramimonas_sp.AAC.1